MLLLLDIRLYSSLNLIQVTCLRISRLLVYEKVFKYFSKSSQICTEHKSCEIDPVKLKESENLDTNRVIRTNKQTKRTVWCVYLCVWVSASSDPSFPPLQENLRQYVDRIFNVITTSGVRCPTVMCDIFFSLRESAATRFQGNSPPEWLKERKERRHAANKEQETDDEEQDVQDVQGHFLLFVLCYLCRVWEQLRLQHNFFYEYVRTTHVIYCAAPCWWTETYIVFAKYEEKLLYMINYRVNQCIFDTSDAMWPMLCFQKSIYI